LASTALVLPANLEHVRSFLAVASHLHFGRAAVALNRTQPSVTQHVAKLEAALGVPLLVRTSRSVTLTDAGRRFAARMTDVVAASDDAVAELSRDEQSTSPLRLAHTPLARALAPQLQAAADEAGAVGAIHCGWENDLLADLRSGRLAAVVGHALPTGPDIAGRHLYDDPLVAVLNDDEQSSRFGAGLRLADLQDHELLLGPSSLSPRWEQRISDLYRAATGTDPTIHRIAVRADRWYDDLAAARTDNTMALLPASALPPNTIAHTLEPPATVPLTLTWLPTTIRPATRRALRTLQQTRRAPRTPAPS
jgi:DNA-binding transcriptional LysR family regulator